MLRDKSDANIPNFLYRLFWTFGKKRSRIILLQDAHMGMD
jgi:hypothetical protein